MRNDGKLDKLELIKARSENKTIGLAQGSWELFHLNHLEYIKNAKKLCDYLIIAMDSYEKKKNSEDTGITTVPDDERYIFIKQSGIANDIVIKDANEEKWSLIKKIRPDVLIAREYYYSNLELINLEEYCTRIAILSNNSKRLNRKK